MAAKILTQVVVIDEIKPHPNADRLELAVIKGWQCVVKKGEYKTGDKCIYFQPDTILPKEWTDKFGVTQYCSEKPQGMRIKSAKLRGCVSLGLLVPCENDAWEIGEDVSVSYKAEKYEPPIAVSQGDIEPDHPLFPKYTDIENLRNYPHVLQEGEEVVVTEKIHGTNVRIGMIEGEWMAGSSKNRRKRPSNETESFYWYPYSLTKVRNMIERLAQEHKVVILFGETYGKVQNLRYGLDSNIAFRAFDLYLDGHYANWDVFKSHCERFEVEMVPFIDEIPYSIDKIKELSEGQSLIPGAEHIREGVVIKPVAERFNEEIGRVVLKFVSDNYLAGKYHECDTKDV